MKVDLNRKFKDFKGNETAELVSDQVAEALYMAGSSHEFPIRKEDKFRAYRLCQKIINNNGVIEVESEDISLIKDVSSVRFVSGAYGQICDLLEGRPL